MSAELVNLHSFAFSVAPEHRSEQLVWSQLNFWIVDASFLLILGFEAQTMNISQYFESLVHCRVIPLPGDDFAITVGYRFTIGLSMFDILEQGVMNMVMDASEVIGSLFSDLIP